MNKLHTTLPGLVNAVHAADCGSFTAAAEVLGVTPAAVSKSVAALEAALEVRLFNRTTRQLSLTEEGRAFIAQAKLGLQALDDAAAQARQGLQPHGLVRVNCPVGFGRSFVLPALPKFFAQHPAVRVELVLNDQAVDLVQGGFDVGIRGGSQPPDGMVARKICDVPSVLVASPRYLKARGTPRTSADLAGHDLLRVRFLTGRMSPWVFKTANAAKALRSQPKDAQPTAAFDGAAQLVISDPALMLDAALLHMGIAHIGRHHAHEALARGSLVEVLASEHVGSDARMSLFYPHRAGLAPRVRVLVDHLMQHFAQEPALQVVSRKR
jgi:DNA-binding transcriptional LysR family regulator